MARVLMTAQVQDGVQWEKSFRTHGDIFATYGLLAPVEFTVSGNDVAISVEVADAGTFLKTMGETETQQAMEADGVNRASVRVYVLDRSAFGKASTGRA